MKHDPADVRRASKLFKALAHPSRLEIACRLADCSPKTQTQLVDELGWPQSSIARHLVPLRELGLVEAERAGVEVRLALRDPIVQTLFRSVCEWLEDHPNGGTRESTRVREASSRAPLRRRPRTHRRGAA
jgi:ArsR family transcriptional regulator